MRPFIVLLVLGMGVIMFGVNRGWFASRQVHDAQRTAVTVTFDRARFDADKEQFRRDAQRRLQEIEERLERLRSDSKRATGDGKQQIDSDVKREESNWESAKKNLDE